jgi:hypothetical protein
MGLITGPAVHVPAVPALKWYRALSVFASVVHFAGGNWLLTPAPATNVLPRACGNQDIKKFVWL